MPRITVARARLGFCDVQRASMRPRLNAADYIAVRQR